MIKGIYKCEYCHEVFIDEETDYCNETDIITNSIHECYETENIKTIGIAKLIGFKQITKDTKDK
jgi:hypothetical protein